MPAPVIDPESSVLSYPQWMAWEHTFSASNTPTSWTLASGSFPTGMTFQPTTEVLGTASTDLIEAVAHGFAAGTRLIFATLTGGSGLTAATNYFVINANDDDFQLALTPGGAPVLFTTDITAATVLRPGYLTGTATVPGISKVRLTATNGSGTSPEVLFTIGIEPSAPALDANIDVIHDLVTNAVSMQGSSVVTSTAAVTEPIIFIKEGDDLMLRVRYLRGATFIGLDTEDGDLRLVLKELEPESALVVSTEFARVNTGANTHYLLHAKFDGDALASALSNYERDGGTFFDALAELEITYANPDAVGPLELVRTSRTFKIRIERDLADNA